MEKYGNWEVLKTLGEGGQGRVYLAKNTKKTGDTNKNLREIIQNVKGLASIQEHGAHIRMAQLLVDALSYLMPKEIDPGALGAIKVLHEPPEKQGYEKAKERIKREVDALSQVNHPNILKILDHNIEEGWFVGEYHARGPLSIHQDLYKGDMLRALEAFKSLVEGVCELHRANIVHRDIKPHNVFLSTDNRLVLGDLGIVFFADPSHTRVTDSYENVGSRDWMPGWAMGTKIEDIHPSFDVFCLGKLLWAMLSGRSLLRLWYHHRDEYELEKMFPRDESIKWARTILDRCIVENEEDCTLSTLELLLLVDHVLQAVKRHAQVVAENVERRCEVCGIGQYRCIANENQTGIRNFGLEPTGSSTFKVFTCSHCGHVQIFHIPNPQSKPNAWKKRESS